MINAIIDALPTYWMALFRIPKGVIKDIDKLRRSFYRREIGEAAEKTRKLHTISWSKICKDKREGGLGIKQLQKKNITILAKWWWRGQTEVGKLWHNILKSKYGTHFLSNPCNAQNCISPMIKSISRLQVEKNLALFEGTDYRWI